MKKYIIILVIFCLLLSCSSCSADGYEHVSGDDSSQSDSPVPPCCLGFDSWEDINELKSMLDKDDATVTEYLASKDYHMNGLRSKSDIAALLDRLGGLNILQLDSISGYTLVTIDYTFEYDLFELFYERGDDRIRVQCYVYDPGEKIEAAEYAKENKISDLTVASNSIGLYRIVTDRETVFNFKCQAVTENSRIAVTLTEDDPEVIQDSIAPHMSFTTLDQLLDG